MAEISQIRPEMVEAAKKFMTTPKVCETPFSEQREFLRGKGVTDAEIEEARSSLPAMAPALQSSTQQYYGHPPPQEQNKFISFAQSALVVGSISYAGYRFLRSYVLPNFFDLPDPALEETRMLQQQVNELQNSMKFVIDSVSQTTQTLAMQQEEISKALMSISNRDTDLGNVEHGIRTIKSLLLSHNQFTPIQTSFAPAPAVPSWQRADPPANFVDMQKGESMEKEESVEKEEKKEEKEEGESVKVEENGEKQEEETVAAF